MLGGGVVWEDWELEIVTQGLFLMQLWKYFLCQGFLDERQEDCIVIEEKWRMWHK